MNPATACEHRGDRAYDDQDPSTIIFPEPFRLAATFARSLTPSMTTEAIKAHRRHMGLTEWWA